MKSLYGDLTQVPDKYSWRCLCNRAGSEDGEVSKANRGPGHKERRKQASEQFIATADKCYSRKHTGAQLTGCGHEGGDFRQLGRERLFEEAACN